MKNKRAENVSEEKAVEIYTYYLENSNTSLKKIGVKFGYSAKTISNVITRQIQQKTKWTI